MSESGRERSPYGRATRAGNVRGQHRQQVFSYVGHVRLLHEPEHVVRRHGQLGSLPGAPLGPGLARRAVEDVRLEARLVLLRLRFRTTPQEHTWRRRGERRSSKPSPDGRPDVYRQAGNFPVTRRSK